MDTSVCAFCRAVGAAPDYALCAACLEPWEPGALEERLEAAQAVHAELDLVDEMLRVAVAAQITRRWN